MRALLALLLLTTTAVAEPRSFYTPPLNPSVEFLRNPKTYIAPPSVWHRPTVPPQRSLCANRIQRFMDDCWL